MSKPPHPEDSAADGDPPPQSGERPPKKRRPSKARKPRAKRPPNQDRGPRATTGVPDERTVGPDEAAGLDDEVYWGGEAVVPPGDYGPPISSNLPDARVISSEVRELERRVNARLTPAYPIEKRRQLRLGFLWKRYRDFAMRDRSDVVDEFGRDPVYASRIEPLLDFLYRQYFRVSAHGLDRVPASGRGLIVANHSGALPYDGAILMHALRTEHPAGREVRPLVEDFVFHFPYLGTFINRIGGVRACQENAERLLDGDQLVAVFPEGIKGIGKSFKNRYQLQRFGRGGFIKLALRTRAPIIPVAIVGAEEIHPMLLKVTWFAKTLGIPYVPITPTFPWLGPFGAIPLPSKWSLHFGEPLDLTGELGPEAAEDRILVNRLAETVRTQIQALIDGALAERRSVFFG
jgi:1-acyl-sn-glycerol-3-phosphate acyltransferase